MSANNSCALDSFYLKLDFESVDGTDRQTALFSCSNKMENVKSSLIELTSRERGVKYLRAKVGENAAAFRALGDGVPEDEVDSYGLAWLFGILGVALDDEEDFMADEEWQESDENLNEEPTNFDEAKRDQEQEEGLDENEWTDINDQDEDENEDEEELMGVRLNLQSLKRNGQDVLRSYRLMLRSYLNGEFEIAEE